MKFVNETLNHSPRDRFRPVGWLLLAAGVVGALLVAARLRRATPPNGPALTAEPASQMPVTAFTESADSREDSLPPRQRDFRLLRAALADLWARRALRWTLFVGATIVFAWLLLTLERPLSTLLLAAAGVVPAAAGARTGLRWTGRALRGSPLARVLLVRSGPLAHVLGAGAVTLMYIGVQVLRPASGEPLPEAALALLLAGGLTLGAALRMAQGTARVPVLALPAATHYPAAMTRAHRVLFGGGLVLLTLLGLVNGPLVQNGYESPFTSHLQFTLLCLGVIGVVLGLGGGRLLPRLRRVNGWEWVALALITLAALALRLWELETSVRLFVDELNFAAPVRAFHDIDNIALLVPFSGVAAFPFVFPYWQAITVEWFGQTFSGLRAASAIVGALTIPAVYLLGRSLFDRKTALAAAVLLATLPPHLHFSRIGMNNIADPLFATLGLAFLARGITQGRRAEYAAGGALLGLTHYFYEGGRLLYWPLAAVWLVGLALLWRPRLRWSHLLVALVAALIVAAPIYTTLWSTERPLAARATENDTALSLVYWRGVLDRGADGIVKHVRERMVEPFLIYIQLREASLFYGGKSPLLLTLISPLALLGFFALLWRPRAPGSLLLLLWVVGASLGNSMLVENMHSPRYVVVFPALALLAAVGLRHTLALILPKADTLSHGWARLAQPQWIALAVVTLALGTYQADYYFNRHIPVYNQQLRESKPHRDPQDAVLRSLSFSPGTEVHIISQVEADGGYTQGFAGFFREDLRVHVLAAEDFDADYIEGMTRGVDHAFYVEPGLDRVLVCLRRYFYLRPPQASPYADIRAKDQFTLYYAPYIPGYSETLLSALPEAQGCR
jgi:4-amino-4-deoxy-L-arabinose transferase-like glycosyltransferase